MVNVMDNFCNSSFWETNLTWNITTQPDFTPCFQETVLVWIPCLFLWLLTPYLCISSSRTQRAYIPLSLLHLFKTFLVTVLCLLSIGELLESILNEDSVFKLVEYQNAIIKSLTYILVFSILIFHRRKGVHTSGILIVFWLLLSLITIINVRSLIRSSLRDHLLETVADWHISELKFTLRIVEAPIIIAQLILSCIADRRAQDPFRTIGEDYANSSPENECSFLSLATFSWLDSLLWLGYKRPLTQDDLFALKAELKTSVVTEKFDRLLLQEIERAKEEKKRLAVTRIDQDEEGLLGRYDSQRRSWIRLIRKDQPRRPTPVVTNTGGNSGERRSSDAQAELEEENSVYISTARLIVKSFWPTLLLGSSLKMLTSFLTFASPLLLNKIISFTRAESTEPSWRGWLYAFGLFFLSILDSLISNQEQRITMLNVLKAKTCLSSALYQKTLKLSQKGRKEFTAGQIVNLMSTDANRISEFISQFNSLYSAPIQLTMSMVLLYQQLGSAVFAGLIVMALSSPLNAYISVRLKELQSIVMRTKDKRIKLLGEIFNGIKIIKIHAWEDSFRERTEAIREKEIKTLSKQTWFSAGITFTFVCLPFIVSLASFGTFVLINPDNVLDANKVFVSLSLFNILRIPLAILPMLLTGLSLFLVSIKRVNRFFEGDEIDPNVREPMNDDKNVIKIENGTFKWDAKSEYSLEKINVTIPKGKLIAVVGSVGSGKSTLLSAMLGNIDKYEGRVFIRKENSFAYVPQEAWILNATIKNNIKLNKVYNEEKYQKILQACALQQDLKTLPFGDESEIGEKGLNLSGGQKQRVSIARAVYADTDVYLFDDPLSAVDAHVGRSIFDNVMGPRGMLSDRTRVLVTNKLSVLPDVDEIIVLKEGQIVETGTYEQLLSGESFFSQLLISYIIENSPDQNINVTSAQDKMALVTKELKRLEDKQKELDEQDKLAGKGKSKEETPKKQEKQAEKEPAYGGGGRGGRGGNLTGQEVSQVGSVSLDIHINFIRTMGINMVISLCIYILSSVFSLGTNLWLSDWSNDAANVTLSHDAAQRGMRLGVYAALGIGESVCIIFSTLLLNFACLRGSKILHNQMLARVIRAPMSWFNTTPSGRIINRFSKDVDVVDVSIRFNVRLLMVTALRTITSMVLISVGSAYSLIFVIPIVLVYFLFQIFYISSSRQLKRIESTTRSPIYNHFSETIDGVASVRAFQAEREFVLEACHRIDTNNSAYYLSSMAARWLAIRLESLGDLVVLIAALTATLGRDTISPGIAGLTVTYSLTITQVMSFLVRTYSDYENNVVSVERLIEYTQTPVEPEDDGAPSDNNWPTNGQVVFQDYSARYRPELDLVVKEFNLDVKPTEKVGLVGRTGAGKSSITLSLFRLLEPASGRIIIDDVDISHINLKILRSRLSIIPQEPVLFTGTIRQNLDPQGSCPDEQIWRAIDLAHLSPFLRSLPEGLEYPVSEGGSNFSVGQKQLFCLARALLRRSKILVLDEATAAVDMETDQLIQQTIRKEFKQSTILTIAHRLETIQDYDRVVVMENGKLAEEGPPSTLIRTNTSRYHSLAKEAGLTV